MASQAPQVTIPTLHHLVNSTSFRVLWALEEIAVADPSFQFKVKSYPRDKGVAPPELKEVFPLGKSPALTLEYADPARREPLPTYQIRPGVLTEGRLILQYLADEHSRGIWNPASLADQRRDVFFQAFANQSAVDRVHYMLFLDVIKEHMPFGLRQIIGLVFGLLRRPFKADLKLTLQLLEDELSSDKPWFAGANFGLADINMCYAFDLMTQRGYFDGRVYQKLMDWHTRVQARDGYKRALANGGSYNFRAF